MSSPFDSESEDNLNDPVLEARPYDKEQQSCCSIGRIELNEASKVGDHIEYVVVVNEHAVNRRYSDFESMRKILMRLYPHLIVPPIPQKHSIMASLKGNKTKDEEIVAIRKKMLLSFLRKVTEHPVLSKEHLFHRFLEQGPWSDVLFSSNLTTQKNKSIKSKLSPARKLKNPDLTFLSYDDGAAHYCTSINSLEKAHQRIVKKLEELQDVYNELGLQFNGIGLNVSSEVPKLTDQGDISTLLENVGGVFDTLHDSSGVLCIGMNDLQLSLHEYAQYTEVVVDLLKARHNRQSSIEQLEESLEDKKFQLSNLESGTQTLASGGGFFGSIGDKLHQIVDKDPDTTRRNNIAKVKESIDILTKQQTQESDDLVKFNDALTQELARFQDVKRLELKVLLERFQKLNTAYFEKSSHAWSEIK